MNYTQQLIIALALASVGTLQAAERAPNPFITHMFTYFPHPSGTDYKTTWKIGVATSTNPTSGFKEQGYIKGIKAMIDPCVFIDDDDQAYLFYGGPKQPHGVKLKDNMVEIDGELQFIEGLDHFKEEIWVFKRKGIYYAMYPDGTKPANRMHYAMSEHPLGPFTHKGVILEGSDVVTTHGSIVEYKGQWYSGRSYI